MPDKIKINILIALLMLGLVSKAQSIKILTEGSNTTIRGLSVVNDKTIWVSGSGGTVGKSLDNGITWKWMLVKGFEKIDFRDIEAFDETSAVIMGIGEPAYILKTGDGGDTWKVVFESKLKGMFLDAMEFWNKESGIVVGDPIDNKIFIARTFDGGINWRTLPTNNYPIADSGEALFAGSGTNIRRLNKSEAVFVTGGLKSRLFMRDKKIDLPISQGKETTGANSIAIKKEQIMIVVGGDYLQEDSSNNNCVISSDAGQHWAAPQIPPSGYKSCIEYLGKKKWICCGPTGTDISNDDGKTWQSISKESFIVCRKAKDGKSVFLAGSDGKIGKYISQKK